MTSLHRDYAVERFSREHKVEVRIIEFKRSPLKRKGKETIMNLPAYQYFFTCKAANEVVEGKPKKVDD